MSTPSGAVPTRTHRISLCVSGPSVINASSSPMRSLFKPSPALASDTLVSIPMLRFANAANLSHALL